MRHLQLTSPRRAGLAWALRLAGRPASGVIVASLAMLAACRADEITRDADARTVPVTISAALTPEQQQLIAGMSVEVTGPGMPTPVVAELDVAGTTVNGTVRVPVGGNRRFAVHAYDATATETYFGSATTNVRPGTNPTLAITLYARSGGVPVVVTVGTLGIALDPATVTVAVGASATVTATVTDAGAPYAGDVVRWGALDPTLARLEPGADGRTLQLTGLRAGSTTLVASIGGVATAMSLTVTAVNPGPERYLANLMAGGPAHTCAIALRRGPQADDIGRVLCWGRNAQGQVGASGAGPYLTPVLVAEIQETAPFNLRGLVVGDAHSCAMPLRGASSGDPTVAGCWGDASAFGGDATVRGVQRIALPAGETTWHLAAGPRHTCVTSMTGIVYCAGDPADGRLGGTPATPRALVATAPRGGVPFFAVAAGRRHTCAINNAWELWCWGDNSRGQLGDGSTTSSATPVQVAGAREYSGVWAGDDVTCATTSMVEVFCWGDNARGQLRRPPGATATEGPLPYATTPRLVFASTVGQFIDQEVPQLLLDDFSITAWSWANGAFTEATRFPGVQFIHAASFGERACGLPFIATLQCTGTYPGNGSTTAAGLVSIDLGAGIAAGFASLR